jgi:hypothetical protein
VKAIEDERYTSVVDGDEAAVADKDECISRRRSARSVKHAQRNLFLLAYI